MARPHSTIRQAALNFVENLYVLILSAFLILDDCSLLIQVRGANEKSGSESPFKLGHRFGLGSPACDYVFNYGF
jgi:hypothetical protein